MNFNTLALGIFSAIILLIGVMVFFLSDNMAMLSTTYLSNLFRTNIGLVGIIVALFNNKKYSRISNFILGILLAFQSLASSFNLFPEHFFQWTILDDILNVDIGATMIFTSFFEND